MEDQSLNLFYFVKVSGRGLSTQSDDYINRYYLLKYLFNKN